MSARGAGRGRRGAAAALLTLAATAGGGIAAPATAAAGGAPKLGRCAAGEVCLWERPGFRGERRTYELKSVTTGSCVPLTKGASAQSFANRTGRPVTLYQSGECAETGDFHTHPSGSWTPQGAYRVRALKVWER